MPTMPATSPFSFHCMICFEEFDQDERYPVVLPCGHTYVCHECASRIDRCMECRTSLLAPSPSPPPNPTQPQLYLSASASGEIGRGTGGGRQRLTRSSITSRSSPSRAVTAAGFGTGSRLSRHSLTSNTPSQTRPEPERQRLPLPKNAVLMSLMEATDILGEDTSTACPFPPPSTSADDALLRPVLSTVPSTGAPSGFVVNDDDNDDGSEEEKIRIGASLALGICGTYAVAVREGLILHLNGPMNGTKQGWDTASETESHASEWSATSSDNFDFGEGISLQGAAMRCVSPPPPSITSLPPKSKLVSSPTSKKLNRRSRKSSFSLNHHVNELVSDYKKRGGVESTLSSFLPTSPLSFNGMENDSKNITNKNINNEHRPTSPGIDENESNAGLGSMVVRLSYGDRIQVVSMDQGWARLSRGYGFIHCPKGSELVKVGGPLDKACKIEAMLRSLAVRRNQLKREKKEIENMSIKLMKTFQSSLSNDDDITVVPASTFSGSGEDPNEIVDENGKENVAGSPNNNNKDSDASSETSSNSSDDIRKPVQLERHDSTQYQRSRLACFANEMFNYGSRDNNDSGDNGDQGPIRTVHSHPPASSPPSFGWRALNSSPSDIIAALATSPSMATEPPPAPRTQPSAFASSFWEYSAGAREWRRQNGMTAARNVDFRTGRSGHMAIHSTLAHPHEFIERTSTGSSIGLKMSCHSGLTVPKRGGSPPRRF